MIGRPSATGGRESTDAAAGPGRERWLVVALIFACLFPSLLTWLYFVRLADAPAIVQQATYAVGKTFQFAFPAVFAVWALGEIPRLGRAGRPALVEGLVSGAVIAGSILALYHLLSQLDADLLTLLSRRVESKIEGLGIGTPARYLGLGLFYSLGHSLLEEYYWRWFVYARLRRLLSRGAALTLGSLAFAAHHLLLMGFYAGWGSPFTYLFTLAVAIGGAYWAWLFERRGTLAAPWLSHLLVDAAIFGVGWQLI